MFVWSYFRLPETWNRSYHELDVLFAKKVPARQFSKTIVDPFNEHEKNMLAIQYETKDETRRPSFVPSISKKIGDKAELAQRRASVVTVEGQTSRRPSIAPAVTDFLQRNSMGARGV